MLSQLLQVGMEDAMESLLARDDKGGWYRGTESSCNGGSSIEEDDKGHVGGMWP